MSVLIKSWSEDKGSLGDSIYVKTGTDQHRNHPHETPHNKMRPYRNNCQNEYILQICLLKNIIMSHHTNCNKMTK